jgi:hypothetical protein
MLTTISSIVLLLAPILVFRVKPSNAFIRSILQWLILGISPSKSPVALQDANFPIPEKTKTPTETDAPVDKAELDTYKALYFKLQNLEHHPDVLGQARDHLVSLFAESISQAKTTGDGILSIPTFDAEKLAQLLKNQDDKITLRWESYLERRKSGSPREVFRDLEHAKWWLKQISPVKLVDGAWLGHIHKVSTPFALRSVTKKAWQVMSEELGDGEVSKNHVYLWRELMEDIKADLPASDSEDFIHPRHGLNKPHIWKAAVAQLLISIFPHEFLPEILGFNMHFEMLTWDTMCAIKELKELGLNDYYFLLHISIDNADSGHTAMAMQAVVDYLMHLQSTTDEATVQQAWKRIQTGFSLSETLVTSPDAKLPRQTNGPTSSSSPYEGSVMKIFHAKAEVSQKLHCASKVSINGRKLVDWLDPVSFESEEWRKDFVRSLANSRAWVEKGDSAGSRFMGLLAWGGKMFGAFTNNEIEVVRSWIDSLSNLPDPDLYWTFVGREKVSSDQQLRDLNVCRDYPVFSTTPKPDELRLEPLSMAELNAPVASSKDFDLEALVPIWFAHSSVLEGFVTTPARTMGTSASALVQVLRAQYGFRAEAEGVAGTDEYKRSDCIDIVDIGLDLASRSGSFPHSTSSLEDLLENVSTETFAEIVDLSMRPIEHREVLLGMAWAFMNLHELLAAGSDKDEKETLSQPMKMALGEMAVREKAGLQVCLIELSGDEAGFAKFCAGYRLSRDMFASCSR